MVLALLLQGELLSAETLLFDPDTGFRIANYRAPVTDPPPGIDAIDVEQLARMMGKNAVLIDVRPLKIFEILEGGTWVTPEPIETIPDAIWLPNIGMGQIEPWAVEYMEASLEEIARQDQTIVVFCRIDCWHSWNAAQRISAYGFNTKWFDGGVDAWQDWGNALALTQPWPAPGE